MQELLSLLTDHGLVALFTVTLAARIGAPVPAAPLVVLAGALGQWGQLAPWEAAGVSIVANVAGDAVWFVAGRRSGYRVLRLLCRISLSPDSCVAQSESLIERWGGLSLVAAKFVPGVSVVAAPMAGALGMSWLRFTAYGVLGAAAWTFIFLGAGMLFSDNVEQVLDMLQQGGFLAGAVLAAFVAVFVAYRWWRRRAVRRALEVPRIAVHELRELMRTGLQPVLIDLRSTASLELDPRRIPGAMLVELAHLPRLAPDLPRDREVVLYCNCPNEASAAHGALVLAASGITRARPLAGGLDAWFDGRPHQ
jgi:membrane protein DedA with SNARE-associated domain/rhodanese-related sulfurtransferase